MRYNSYECIKKVDCFNDFACGIFNWNSLYEQREKRKKQKKKKKTPELHLPHRTTSKMELDRKHLMEKNTAKIFRFDFVCRYNERKKNASLCVASEVIIELKL